MLITKFITIFDASTATFTVDPVRPRGAGHLHSFWPALSLMTKQALQFLGLTGRREATDRAWLTPREEKPNSVMGITEAKDRVVGL